MTQSKLTQFTDERIEMRHTIARLYLLIFASLALFCLIAVSCKSPVIPDYPVNKDVLYFQDFALSAEAVDLNTNVKGTIFVKGDKEKPEKRHIQISARVEVDPQDWGGVGFYITEGWNVTNIASDFPRGSSTPERYTTTLSAGGEARMVYIGHSRMSAVSGGGEGSIVIEFDPVGKDLPANTAITVGVGSKGDVIVNPVSQKIPVPLNIDYRTPARPVRAGVVASLLVIARDGRTVELTREHPEFTRISSEAVKIIESINSSLYATGPDQAAVRKTIETGDYLEIRFDPPEEITTNRIIETRSNNRITRKWETVRLSSAVFFFSGEFYRLAAWPDQQHPDRYEIFGSGVPFDELERLVRSVN